MRREERREFPASILWVLVGYSMAFGDDLGAGLLGDPRQYGITVSYGW